MDSGRRSELPVAAPGRAGWPWERVDIAPQNDDFPWPRITVVTPSFNQGEFLEATLRSVLLQDYPNLEYLVLDGGSSDNSVEVIRRYEPWLTHWRSAADDGQAAAIASGFEMATGDILCWLNSDDLFLPGALRHIGRLFDRHQTTDVIYGNRLLIDRNGEVIDRHIWPRFLTSWHWAMGQPLAQECCFWRRSIYDAVGGINKEKFFILDYDLFFRMWRAGSFRKTPAFLGCLRQHEATKNTLHPDVWRSELADAKARFRLREPGYLTLRVLNRLDRLQIWLEERRGG